MKNIFSKILYHGSGKTFDKFDFSFMSSGEGQQVHGWGIYLAESKETAQGYKDKLNDKQKYFIQVDGEIIQPKDDTFYRYDDDIHDYFLLHGWNGNIFLNLSDLQTMYCPERHWRLPIHNIDDYITNYLENYINSFYNKYETEHDEDYIKWANEKAIMMDYIKEHDVQMIPAPVGMLATVTIDDSAVLVRELAALSNQDENIQNAIIKAANEPSEYDREYILRQSFKYLYENNYFGETPKESSMKLLKCGIDGIRYHGDFDGWCVVMFNIDKCEIIEKE